MNDHVRYRVIGYTSNGTVVLTISCKESELEKAHDDVMATNNVTLASTQGPFVYSRSSSE